MKRWLFLLCLPLFPWFSQLAEKRLGASVAPGGGLYVWSGERLRRLAPGFENVLADIYWLRTVQYFGSERAFSPDKRFDLLEPLIDITVTLDPRLEVAYRYGAIFLCEPWPTGKGDPAAGIAILERGVRALPKSWQLREDLGFFRYIFLGDAIGGANVLVEGAKLPGAPFYLESLAGVILARGGQRETSRLVWRRMYERAEAGFIRDNALYHLRRLDALDMLDRLNAAVVDYRRDKGHNPERARDLSVDAKALTDPTGVPFAYDAHRGRFWFDPSSRLWRVEGSEK